MTTRASIRKQLTALKSLVEEESQIRLEVEAREVTPERFREIMEGMDAAQRHGRQAADDYFKSLSDGECLRVHRGREEWAKAKAKEITPEHIARLEADGVPVERFTDAEIYAVATATFEDDLFDWSALPEDVLNTIATDPGSVDFEDLAKRYPNKNHRRES
ncbi:hypothetical protein [Geobacter sp. 60473]|uniref:hypothetical protein n=1 Tax=Geobacter sp. 60473 TaxID=3080755 RepID=UPI002B30F6E8|nr:hypothetical protein GEO60473_09490 [Geobacter sp. 60473]